MKHFGLFAALGFALFACSDDTEPTNPQNTNNPPPPVTAAPDTGFRVLAVIGDGTRDHERSVANATVIFDKPGGERVQMQTGVDGIARFEDVDWSLGTAAVTVFTGNPESNIASFVALTKDVVAQYQTYMPDTAASVFPPHDLAAFLFDPAPETARLEGSISNQRGEAVTLSPTVTGSSFQDVVSQYALDVRKGYPFSLIGLDWSLPTTTSVSPRGTEQILHRWVKLDHEPILDKTRFNVDLDRAEQLPMTNVKGKIIIPGGDAGPLGGTTTGYALIRTERSIGNTFLGVVSKIDVSADKSAFEFDMGYCKPAGEKPQVNYIIQKTSDGSYSLAIGLEWPTEGQVIDNMIVSPVVTETSRSLTEPFALDAPADVDLRVQLDNKRQFPKWFIHIPKNTKTFTPPVLDATAKKILGPVGDLTGRVLALGAFDKPSNYYLRSSGSRTFKVK